MSLPKLSNTHALGEIAPLRTAVLVLGAHRSGTSAVTRTISLLGADLPRHIFPPHATNLRGHWESEDWIEIHDRALAQLGLRWDMPLTIPGVWFEGKEAQGYARRLREIIDSDFLQSPLFVAKDPRMCRLLPLWLAALEAATVRPKSIVVIRHPDEVIASLQARDGMTHGVASLLWTRHVCEAELYSRTHPRSFVLYDRLLADWQREIERIGRDLQIEWPVPPENARGEIEAFLTHDLRHHCVEEADSDSSMAQIPFTSEAYAAALAMADEDSPSSRERFDSLRRQLNACGSLLDNLARTVLSAQDEVRLLQNGIFRRDAEMGRLRADQQHFVSDKTSRETEIARLLAEVRRLLGELEGASGAVQYRDREIGRLMTEILRLQASINAGATESARLVAEIDRLSTDVSLQLGHVQYRDREIGRLTGEISRLQSEIDAGGRENGRLAREVERLSTEIKHLTGGRKLGD
jgi:hypothetical protein